MLEVDGEADTTVVIRVPDRQDDVRTTAVLAVLAGISPETVAQRRGVTAEELDGWVQTFVAAGGDAIAGTGGRDEPSDDDDHSDRYLSVVAHELRTPLSMIQGWTELLADGETEPGSVARAVAAISAHVARLRRLADDAIDAAGIATGRLELRPSVVDLADIVRRAVSAYPGDVPAITGTSESVVRVDPDRFGQVIDNLLENARKHGGSVAEIRIGRHGDFGQVTITSPGIPITPEVAQRMFEPYQRGSTTAAGLGLGLYVCRSLVVAHGGRIGLRVDDDGNHFWVQVPLATVRTEVVDVS